MRRSEARTSIDIRLDLFKTAKKELNGFLLEKTWFKRVGS